MKKNSLLIILLLLSTLHVVSCKKDEATASGDSRAVKYELTGNYSGKFLLVASTNNSDFEAIEVNKLPWKLEFTARASMKYALILGTGSDGVAGQTATLKTFVGGKEVDSATATALSSGIISLTSKQYFLK
jgi:hypothetical protein